MSGPLRRVFATAALVGALVAPGLTATAHAGATPSAPPGCGVSSGASWRLVSTTAPCRVVVAVGATVPVSLSPKMRWSALTRSSGVVRVTSTHPATGGLRGSVRAMRVGTALVVASGGAICPPGVACPMYLVRWALRVTVVARVGQAVTVTATEADAGARFVLARGDRFAVRLAGPSNYTWTVPTVSDPTVLQRVSGGPGRAVFLAVGAGSITVSAVDNPNCYPQCLPPSRLVQFTVTVS